MIDLRWRTLADGSMKLEPSYDHNITLRTTCDDCGEDMEQTDASTMEYAAVYCYCPTCGRGITLRVAIP